MRLKALQELKYKEIPDSWVVLADDWTEEKRKEFIVKDNVSFGEWNWEVLQSDWDVVVCNFNQNCVCSSCCRLKFVQSDCCDAGCCCQFCSRKFFFPVGGLFQCNNTVFHSSPPNMSEKGRPVFAPLTLNTSFPGDARISSLISSRLFSGTDTSLIPFWLLFVILTRIAFAPPVAV